MYKQSIDKFKDHLFILKEKKRIAQNLQRCLQHINDSSEASSASSSQNNDAVDETKALNDYIEDLSKALDSSRKKLSALIRLDQLAKNNRDNYNKKTFEDYLAQFKIFCDRKELDFTYEDYQRSFKVKKHGVIFDYISTDIGQAINTSLTELNNWVESECPQYRNTKENSSQLIAAVIGQINGILSGSIDLSDECKENINTLLCSYKEDYISLQQATALLVLLRDLEDEKNVFEEEDMKAFRFMLTQHPFDKRTEMLGVLKNLSKIEANTSWPYFTAFLMTLGMLIGCLVVVAVAAFLIAGTVYLGVSGFTARAADPYYNEEASAQISFFFLSVFSVTPLSAVIGLIALIGGFCLPFEQYNKAKEKCEQNKSDVSDLIADFKRVEGQIDKYQDDCPDFHNNKISLFCQKTGSMYNSRKIKRSSNFFQEVKESTKPLNESIITAIKVSQQIGELKNKKMHERRVEAISNNKT